MFFFRTIITYLRDKQYRNLLLLTFVVLIVGMLGYRYFEGWTYLDSLYFSIITLTTVGYGDFSPQTDGGKVFTILYIIVGVGIILTFIDTIYQHFERTGKKAHRMRLFGRRPDDREIEDESAEN